MRGHVRIAVLSTVVIVGCSAYQTLQELEDEAIVTGDWARVERREAREKPKKDLADAAAYCKAQGMILVCTPRGARAQLDDCACYTRRDL